MEISTLASSKKIISTEMVSTNGPMDKLMTDILSMVKNVALESITSKMVIFTKENIKTTKGTEEGHINGKKGLYFKAYLQMTTSN